MPHLHSGWTDARIQQLRILWAEGHSTAEIGRRLGISADANCTAAAGSSATQSA